MEGNGGGVKKLADIYPTVMHAERGDYLHHIRACMQCVRQKMRPFLVIGEACLGQGQQGVKGMPQDTSC